jgi:hypothetical protein
MIYRVLYSVSRRVKYIVDSFTIARLCVFLLSKFNYIFFSGLQL